MLFLIHRFRHNDLTCSYYQPTITHCYVLLRITTHYHTLSHQLSYQIFGHSHVILTIQTNPYKFLCFCCNSTIQFNQLNYSSILSIHSINSLTQLHSILYPISFLFKLHTIQSSCHDTIPHNKIVLVRSYLSHSSYTKPNYIIINTIILKLTSYLTTLILIHNPNTN